MGVGRNRYDLKVMQGAENEIQRCEGVYVDFVVCIAMHGFARISGFIWFYVISVFVTSDDKDAK